MFLILTPVRLAARERPSHALKTLTCVGPTQDLFGRSDEKKRHSDRYCIEEANGTPPASTAKAQNSCLSDRINACME